MHSYHVFFSTAEGVPAEQLVAQAHLLMETQVNGNLAIGYRILRYEDTSRPEGLADLHLIVDYTTKADREQAFENMKAHFRNDPHAPIMHMATDFNAAFSEDV